MPIEVYVEGAGELPAYSSAGSAGADLHAAQEMEIPPGARAAVPTALALAIPEGCVGLIWPRSGLALSHGIDVLAGVIDSDYRGEVRVVLVNHGDVPWRVTRGARIAQLLVQRVEQAGFLRVAALSGTARGAAGFGSTGR
jgi:dUTP pyrophosphatase